MSSNSITIHGHRGDRGNFPENSLPAFLSAVKKGVDVVEMDVVISKDRQVVVSHEPYMSSLYVCAPDGKPIAKETEKPFNLYEMDYEEIRKFDTGSHGNPNFPQQQKIKTHKPLLEEVIQKVEAFIKVQKLKPVKYNIEIKSVPAEYDQFQPEPQQMVDLILALIQNRKIENRVILQSFDPAPLHILNRDYPTQEISFLVENHQSIAANLTLLQFTPQIYSPDLQLITTRDFIKEIHELGMRIIPWTVNEPEDIRQMIEWGVDGIISDYPERALAARSAFLDK